MDLPNEATPQFYPLNFHPEFGYLAPRPTFRQRFRTAAKAVVIGAAVGAVAVFALMPRDQAFEATSAAFRPAVAATIPTPAAPPSSAVEGGLCSYGRWPYAGSGCLSKPAAAWEPVRPADRVDAAHALVTDPAPEPGVEPTLPAVEQPQAAPSRKTPRTAKRQRRNDRDVRESDPQSAYAGGFADQRPPGYVGSGGIGGSFSRGWGW